MPVQSWRALIVALFAGCLLAPWGDRLSDTDIWNVVNFVRDLAKQ